MIRLLLLLGLFLTTFNYSDSFDFCDNFKIVSVLDFPPSPKTPGGNYFLLTLTVKEDNLSGISNYANIYFEDEFGDTISVPTGPSSLLPIIRTDTIPYILKLNTIKSNQYFPENFQGKLVIQDINKPRCELQYSNIKTSVAELNTTSINSNLVKNTSIYDINGKLILTNYGSEDLDYNELKSGFYIKVTEFENGKKNTKKLLIN